MIVGTFYRESKLHKYCICLKLNSKNLIISVSFLNFAHFFSALGLAGAVAAKSAVGMGGIGLGGMGGIGGGLGGGFGGSVGGHGGPQPYGGPSYSYGNVPTSVQAAPSYYPSQNYVPQQVQQVQPVQQIPVQQLPVQQIQTVQPVYGQPSGGPFSAALAWKSGIVSGITNSLSNGIIGLRPPVAAAPAYSYSYAPAVSAPIAAPSYTDIPVAPIAPAAQQVAPPQAAQVGPVANKPVYVVCDNNN